MRPRTAIIAAIGGAGLFGALVASAANNPPKDVDEANARYAQTMLEQGRQIFRYDIRE